MSTKTKTIAHSQLFKIRSKQWSISLNSYLVKLNSLEYKGTEDNPPEPNALRPGLFTFDILQLNINYLNFIKTDYEISRKKLHQFQIYQSVTVKWPTALLLFVDMLGLLPDSITDI